MARLWFPVGLIGKRHQIVERLAAVVRRKKAKVTIDDMGITFRSRVTGFTFLLAGSGESSLV